MDSPIEEYDLLVILDAEGLGTETNNTEYDRKVFTHYYYYILVSLTRH